MTNHRIDIHISMVFKPDLAVIHRGFMEHRRIFHYLKPHKNYLFSVTNHWDKIITFHWQSLKTLFLVFI